jgi:hypothetical protein
MKLETVELFDDKITVVMDVQSSGITVWTEKVLPVRVEYINPKNWGFVEKIKITADTGADVDVYIQEWEWGKNGKKRLYVLNIANDSVKLEKAKDEYTGWVRILR